MYEPEFAFYDGEKEEKPKFEGLPELEDDVLPPETKNQVNDESSDWDDVVSTESPLNEDLPPIDDPIIFDDDFEAGLPTFNESEPEESSPSDDSLEEGLEEFNEGPPSLDNEESNDDTDSVSPDPEVEKQDEDDEDADNDDNDSASLGEIVSSAVQSLGVAGIAFLKFVQKRLSKIPIIGKFATNTLKTGISLLLILAVPVAIVLVTSAIARSATGPDDVATASLPDNGSAQMSEMTLSDDGKKLTVKITNTGDIIADVTPSATLEGVKLSNPISWYTRTEMGKCTGETVTVDIDDSVETTLKCDADSDNLTVAGKLE